MTDATSARRNLLTGDTIAIAAPVFTGAQRQAAINLMGNAIAEGQAMSIMRLLNKDPSLCLEQVTVKGGGSAAAVTSSFAAACVTHGISSGYLFAIQRGVDPTPLLMVALNKLAANGEGVESDLSLLLSVGADPNADRGSDTEMGVFAKAMHLSYPRQKMLHRPAIVSMLLDAGALPTLSPRLMCPFQTLVRTGGWDDQQKLVMLYKMAARLAKAGLDPNCATGTPPQKPILQALGSKNTPALIALIRIGASTNKADLGGKDLFATMDAQGMHEDKPLVQEALMEHRIDSLMADAPKAPAQSEVKPPADTEDQPRSRRRLGAF